MNHWFQEKMFVIRPCFINVSGSEVGASIFGRLLSLGPPLSSRGHAHLNAFVQKLERSVAVEHTAVEFFEVEVAAKSLFHLLPDLSDLHLTRFVGSRLPRPSDVAVNLTCITSIQICYWSLLTKVGTHLT